MRHQQGTESLRPCLCSRLCQERGTDSRKSCLEPQAELSRCECDTEMWEPCLQPEGEDEPEERDQCSLWHLPTATAILLECVPAGNAFLFQGMPGV